jgi:hypothetical protein
MRYIYYIIIILLGLSAIIGYELKGKGSPPKEAAIVVNGKIITVEEFNRVYSSKSTDTGDKNDFINSLITKELLIQESQREGIDKEESFRKSIQNFYEQSLIKLLMDRKCACLNITITDDELNQYIGFLHKKIHLTVFNFNSSEEARKSDYRAGTSRSMSFEDLSKDMKTSIISLKEGQRTVPIKTGEKYIVIRLDRLENIQQRTPSDSEKVRIKRMLIDERKEKILSDWISDLRKKASIKILISDTN